MKHDIVIAGGGSAGAVLAARRSEDPTRRVLLIEAGPVYTSQSFPSSLTDPNVMSRGGVHDWGYVSEPGSAGQRIDLPRGKVLGGSSATNAAVAIRARRSDFERWRSRGISGWAFEDVLETFKRMENAPASGELHGRTGPFPVRQPAPGELTPSCRAFIASAESIGLRYVDDFNGATQHGAGAHPRNISGGLRCNVAMAYLTEQVRSRPNLTIRGEAEVDCVIFDGRRALGVRLTDGGIETAGETILAAGVYGSPAILMRSGIGPADDLRALDIPVLVDLPVGRRLMDHPFVYTVYALKTEVKEMAPAVGSLVWTRSHDAGPDELDLQIAATHFFDPASSPTGGAIVLAVAVTLPDSVGTFTLTSRDHRKAPRIDLNFLAEDRDRRRLNEGLELAHFISQREPLRDMIDSALITKTDFPSNLRSYHHGTSTVPMGDDQDTYAVVDPLGVVRGVQGLRVVDASIFPEIPSAPTHLTVIMAAEHIAARMG